jgi:hypothetical protein
VQPRQQADCYPGEAENGCEDSRTASCPARDVSIAPIPLIELRLQPVLNIAPARAVSDLGPQLGRGIPALLQKHEADALDTEAF